MTRISTDILWDDELDNGVEAGLNRRQQHTQLSRTKQGSKRGKRIKRTTHAVVDEIARHGDVGEAPLGSYFNPTFSSSRHEREWIFSYLGPFYDSKLITDVLKKVKGGKEANVYCCAAHPDTGLGLIAAKIYRPRMFRNLRNDVRYRKNREILDEDGKRVDDERLLHAVRQGTQVGKEALHTSWLEHEYHTLQLIYEAGGDVPQPIACGHNTILMEYVGEVDLPAPTLNQVTLSREEAAGLYDRLVRNVRLMLDCNRVHADLSAYNVLYWKGEFKIIDFPQAVDPRSNPEAFDIFRRDVLRLCQYFMRAGVRCKPEALAAEFWEHYSQQVKIAQAPEIDDADEDMSGGVDDDQG
jgi:RIO kinase 1